MRLVELTGLQGGTVWVNPDQLDYVSPADTGGGRIYGESGGVRGGATLHFAHGSTVDVKETLADVVARLGF